MVFLWFLVQSTRGYWLIFRSESPWTRRLEDECRREDERRNAQRRERGRGEGQQLSPLKIAILMDDYMDIIWIFSTIKDRRFKYGDIHHHSSTILVIIRESSLNYGCLSTNSDFNEF